VEKIFFFIHYGVNYRWEDDVKIVYPTHSKQEDWSHILKCEGTQICGEQILDSRFRNTDADQDQKRVGCKNKQH
jgi:hypothetical protein